MGTGCKRRSWAVVAAAALSVGLATIALAEEEAPKAPEGHPASAAAGESAAAQVLDGGEYGVPAKGSLVAGFGPLRLVVGEMVPAPSSLEADEAVRYRLRRSIERLGRQAEEPLTWDDGMERASFHLDRHRADPKLASGAVYALESDLLVEAGHATALAVRLAPPAGAGDIAYAVRADIGGVRFLEQEGTLQAGGKPVELPLSFSVRRLCDLPVTVSVATGPLDPANLALAEQVEMVLLDTGPGHDAAAVTSSRAVSAADNIVRPVYVPVVVPHAEAAEGEKGAAEEGGDKKGKKDKKDKKDKKEKKEE